VDGGMNNEDAMSSHRGSSHRRQQKPRSRSSRHLLREIDSSNFIVVADQELESRNDNLPGKHLSNGRPPMRRVPSTNHGSAHSRSLNRRSLSRRSSLPLPRHRREDESKKGQGIFTETQINPVLAPGKGNPLIEVM
jgi:transposase InsO family protein